MFFKKVENVNITYQMLWIQNWELNGENKGNVSNIPSKFTLFPKEEKVENVRSLEISHFPQVNEHVESLIRYML